MIQSDTKASANIGQLGWVDTPLRAGKPYGADERNHWSTQPKRRATLLKDTLVERRIVCCNKLYVVDQSKHLRPMITETWGIPYILPADAVDIAEFELRHRWADQEGPHKLNPAVFACGQTHSAHAAPVMIGSFKVDRNEGAHESCPEMEWNRTVV